MADTDPNPTVPAWEPRIAVLEQIALDTRRALDRIERRLETLERRQHTDFLWVLAIMLGGYAGLLGVMAHGFHWI